MKKKLKKLLSLTLVLGMLQSILSVTAFATGDNEWEQETRGAKVIAQLLSDETSLLYAYAQEGDVALCSADRSSEVVAYTSVTYAMATMEAVLEEELEKDPAEELPEEKEEATSDSENAETEAGDDANQETEDNDGETEGSEDQTENGGQTEGSEDQTENGGKTEGSEDQTENGGKTEGSEEQTENSGSSTNESTTDTTGEMNAVQTSMSAGDADSEEKTEQTISVDVTLGQIAAEVDAAFTRDGLDGTSAIWNVSQTGSAVCVYVGWLSTLEADTALVAKYDGTENWQYGRMAVENGALNLATGFLAESVAGELSFTAADGSVVPCDENGVTVKVDGTITGKASGNQRIIVSGDVTLTMDNVQIDALNNDLSALEIMDGYQVTLIVQNRVSLTGGINGAGIAVPETASVTITGSGSLTAIGNNTQDQTGSGAGIGGTAANGNSGEITIDQLADLSAHGYGVHACGIGSAKNGSSAAITLTDSHLSHVRGGYAQDLLGSGDGFGTTDFEGGSAIGGGGKGGHCGDITVSNCTIDNVYGGSKAAGIGSGCWATCGTITITGSTLSNVLGGSSSSGIGTGRVNNKANSNFSAQNVKADIYIRNSSINVQGGENGAGIGTGYNGDSCGVVGDGTLPTSTIEIADSNIHALGGNAGAAIGGGYKGFNVDIRIDGSTVYAQAGISGGSGSTKSIGNSGASAIGAGANGSNGRFEGGSIAISSDSNVVAISNGGKWAVDLNQTNVSGVQNVFQNMFLVDQGAVHATEEEYLNPNHYYKNAADSCEPLVAPAALTVKMAGVTVVLPAGYICAAVTAGGKGPYVTTTEDGSKFYSFYDNAQAAFDYAGAADTETLGKANADFEAASQLASNSYLYVAIRADATPTTPTPNPDPTPNPTPNPDPTPNPNPTPNPVPPTTVIPDENVPQGTLPAAADIPDEEVPLADAPEEVVTLDEIPDEEVPLADAPETGDNFLLYAGLATMLLSAGGLLVLMRKKEAQ